MGTAPRWEPASFLRRTVAYIVDSVCLSVISFVALVIAVAVEDALGYEDVDGEAGAIFTIVFIAVPAYWFIYHWVCNALGVSPGKRLMSLRIVGPAVAWPRSDGLPPHSRPGAVRGLLRSIGHALGIVPLGVGFWWALWDPENRALHDKLAGTWVVRVAREGRSLPEQVKLPLIRAPRRLRFRYGAGNEEEYVELQRDAVLIVSAGNRTEALYDGIAQLVVANGSSISLHCEEGPSGKGVESTRSFPAPQDLELFISELELRVQAARGQPLSVVR